MIGDTEWWDRVEESQAGKLTKDGIPDFQAIYTCILCTSFFKYRDHIVASREKV